MFERTAQVRDEADLEEVLEDVCRAIAELLGYRAVVVNVYRPAFDDMLTSAAVGSDDSVKDLLGRSSPRRTWAPLLDERFARRGALRPSRSLTDSSDPTAAEVSMSSKAGR